jgi:hypothetical protein
LFIRRDAGRKDTDSQNRNEYKFTRPIIFLDGKLPRGKTNDRLELIVYAAGSLFSG